MPRRGECSICANPETRQFVDDLLDKSTKYSDVSAQLAMRVPAVFAHKSSVGRHALKCYRPMLRLRVLEKKKQVQRGTSLVVQWPSGKMFACPGCLRGVTDHDCENREVSASELRGVQHAVIAVEFEIPRPAAQVNVVTNDTVVNPA